MDYGFREPIIDETHWLQGKINSPILQPNSQWDEFLPVDEFQKHGSLETENCTGFAALNTIETMEYRLTGKKPNYSDRWIGTLAGTIQGGNDPHTVFEAARKKGLVPEEMLPFDETITTITEYYSAYRADKNALIVEAKKWLDSYDLYHEWLFTRAGENQRLIVETLKYSPIAASALAWVMENGVFVKPNPGGSNHLVEIYGCSPGQYFTVLDTYDNTRKKLAWNYKFDCAKKISLIKRTEPRPKDTFFERIKKLITNDNGYGL